MLATQDTSPAVKELADRFRDEILIRTDIVAISTGPFTLTAYQDNEGYGPIFTTPKLSSARGSQRVPKETVHRLAADVRAKILARAHKIDAMTRMVSISFTPRGGGFDIELTITDR